MSVKRTKVCFVFLFIFGAVGLVLFVLTVLQSKHLSSELFMKTQLGQFRQLQQRSTGKATSNYRLGLLGYKRSRNWDKVHVYENVIPEMFRNTRYQCSGSCFCEDDEERRSPFSKGMVAMVTAVSTMFAYKVGQASMEELCEEQYSGECERGNLVGKVDECDIIDLDAVENGGTGVTEKEEELWNMYECEGRCLDNSWMGDNKLKEYTKEKFGECSEKTLKRQVAIPEKGIQKPQLLYMVDLLDPYCAEQTRVHFNEEYRKIVLEGLEASMSQEEMEMTTKADRLRLLDQLLRITGTGCKGINAKVMDEGEEHESIDFDENYTAHVTCNMVDAMFSRDKYGDKMVDLDKGEHLKEFKQEEPEEFEEADPMMSKMMPPSRIHND